MNEMIDKVAKAIYEKRNGAGCRPWSRQSAAYQAPYLDDARAAIGAMREPTSPIILAGLNCNAWAEPEDTNAVKLLGGAFQAMINEALK